MDSNEASKLVTHTISTLWDNRSIADSDRIQIQLQYVKNPINREEKDLQIRISAPYYDDPKIPDNASVGSMDKLWEYEVVEVFLLGEDQHYLETEFGPKGQYLLLQLHGYRNVTEMGLTLDQYTSHISGNQWYGIATIPSKYLPKKITKFNAYAIHGTDPHRQYLSLFPTPTGKYTDPDFHRLDYFQEFDLNDN